MGNALSPGQTNLGIKQAVSGEAFIHPSFYAFEQEIIWSLYQMTRKLG